MRQSENKVKPAGVVAVKSVMTGVAALVLVWIVASVFWGEPPQAPENRTLSAPVAMAQPPVSAPAPRPAATVAAIRPALRCETSHISGSHTARAEWEARQGALEDVADVCPAGKVSPAQVSCAPVAGAEGIMGYAAIKCVQQAACTLCGENLARMREVAHAVR